MKHEVIINREVGTDLFHVRTEYTYTINMPEYIKLGQMRSVIDRNILKDALKDVPWRECVVGKFKVNIEELSFISKRLIIKFTVLHATYDRKVEVKFKHLVDTCYKSTRVILKEKVRKFVIKNKIKYPALWKSSWKVASKKILFKKN